MKNLILNILKKSVLILSGLFLVCFIVLVAFSIYFYHSPLKVKTFIEKAALRSGINLRIQNFNFSITPFKISAEDIHIISQKGLKKIDIHTSLLSVELGLDGKFGNRSLIIKDFVCSDFLASIEIDSFLSFFEEKMSSQSSIFFYFRSLFCFLFFKDIQIKSISIQNGDVKYSSKNNILNINNIHATLNGEQEMDINGQIKFIDSLNDIKVQFPKFHITADQVLNLDSKIKATIKLFLGSFQYPDIKADYINSEILIEYDHINQKVNMNLLGFECGFVSLASYPSIVKDLKFFLKANADLKTELLTVSEWRCSSKDLFELSGTASIKFFNQFNARLFKGSIYCEKLLSYIEKLYDVKDIDLSGLINLTGNIQWLKASSDLIGNVTAFIQDNEISYNDTKIKAKGKIKGELNATFPDLKLKGDLLCYDIGMHGQGVGFEYGSVNMALQGKYPELNIDDLNFNIPLFDFIYDNKKYNVDEILLALKKGQIDIDLKQFSFPVISIDSKLIKNLNLSANGTLEECSFILTGDNINIIGAANDLGFIPDSWQFKTNDFIDLNAFIVKKGNIKISAKFGFKELNCQNKEETFIAEKIDIDFLLNSFADLKHNAIKSDINIESTKGELLFDKFYVDFSKNNLFFSLKKQINLKSKSLKLYELNTGLKKIFSAGVNGDISYKQSPNFNFVVSIPETKILPIFNKFAKEPFEFDSPQLAGIQVDGVMSANFNINNRFIKGNVNLDKAKLISWDNKVAFNGIEFDIPVWYEFKKQQENDPVDGKLFIKSMKIPFLQDQSFAIGFKVLPDYVAFDSDAAIKIGSGQVSLQDIECKQFFSGNPIFKTNIIFDSIPINSLIKESSIPQLDGIINGELLNVIFTNNRISSKGAINADIFDGKIVIKSPEVKQLFSATPVLKCDIKMNDLFLDKITTGTSFGKITGILEGYINNLEIVNNQPQRFELLLETKQKKGVVQRISVTAVESISSIGGSDTPFIGMAGLVTGFIKDFSYKKIGVIAFLENDVFKVNGTVNKGGLEYLVKKDGLFGVDVINWNPDNRISFKDMVKRIKRIKMPEEGPVID